MKYLRELFSLRNIAYTLVVAAVAVAEIVDALLPQLNWLSISDNFLLLVLGFLVTGQLVDRVQSQPHKCLDVLNAWPPFDEYVANAQDEIFVSAGSMDGLLRKYSKTLKDKANNGCKIHLVLMDPRSPAVSCVEAWADPALTGTYHDDLYTAQNILARLWEGLNATGRKNFKVKLDHSIPALSVLILDGSRSSGKIRVDIQPFQCTVAERPVFELTRKGNQEHWYRLFHTHYSVRLWECAAPFDLEAHLAWLKQQEAKSELDSAQGPTT